MVMRLSLLIGLILGTFSTYAQFIQWNNQAFTATNVKASVVQMGNESVLKIERDLKTLPFDEARMETTVDEPTYLKLDNFQFENGTIEVKVLSRLQHPLPFKAARGFIGIAFRIAENDTAFENIYLRPSVGRSESQLARNHSVQYFAYPHYKFQRLRKEAPGTYETYADIGLNEWISLKIEVRDRKALLYINGQLHPSFIVGEMKAATTIGAIGLWVDIGTEGFFKDLKIIRM